MFAYITLKREYTNAFSYQPRSANRWGTGMSETLIPTIASPNPRETSVTTFGSSKNVVAFTHADARCAGFPDLKIPEPDNNFQKQPPPNPIGNRDNYPRQKQPANHDNHDIYQEALKCIRSFNKNYLNKIKRLLL